MKIIKAAEAQAAEEVDSSAALEELAAASIPSARETASSKSPAGVFARLSLVEVACGDEGEPEVWMPGQVVEVMPVVEVHIHFEKNKFKKNAISYIITQPLSEMS